LNLLRRFSTGIYTELLLGEKHRTPKQVKFNLDWMCAHACVGVYVRAFVNDTLRDCGRLCVLRACCVRVAIVFRVRVLRECACVYIAYVLRVRACFFAFLFVFFFFNL